MKRVLKKKKKKRPKSICPLQSKKRVTNEPREREREREREKERVNL